MHSENLTLDQTKRSFIEVTRRAQIVECAVEVIAELGFARASLAQIARRAGISTGVILYHFANKDALISEVAAHVFAAGEAFIRPRVPTHSARAALRAFITASVGFIASNPSNTLAVMAIIRAGTTDSGAPRFNRAVTRSRWDGFTAVLRAGQASGEFRPFSVEVMATTIIEALDAIPPALALNPQLDFDAYAEELAELFDRATTSGNAPGDTP